VRGILRPLLVTLVLVVGYVGWVFYQRSRHDIEPVEHKDPAAEKRVAEFLKTYGGKELKILGFYSPNGDLMEGDKTSICYGVLNAKSVRMEPPLPNVGVSLNRCLEVAPENDTQYTLFAEGFDGSVAMETFVIRTHPDPYTLPRVKKFQLLRTIDDPGKRVFWLSFDTENAELTEIEPKAFGPMGKSVGGRFYVAPEKTTTYTITVTDKKGRKSSQSLTVEVPGPKG